MSPAQRSSGQADAPRAASVTAADSRWTPLDSMTPRTSARRHQDDEGLRTAPLSRPPERAREPATERRVGSERPPIDRCRHDKRDRPSRTGPLVDHRPIGGCAADTHCHPFVSIHARIQRAIRLTVYRYIVPSPLARGNPPGRLRRRLSIPADAGYPPERLQRSCVVQSPTRRGNPLGRLQHGASVHPRVCGGNPPGRLREALRRSVPQD